MWHWSASAVDKGIGAVALSDLCALLPFICYSWSSIVFIRLRQCQVVTQLITYIVPWACISQPSKRHLDQFSHWVGRGGIVQWYSPGGVNQWRRAHWARSGLGPTFNPAGRARSGQVRLFWRLLLSENNYFDQLNFTFDCHDYIAVTHNRNCNRSSIPSTSSADVCT